MGDLIIVIQVDSSYYICSLCTISIYNSPNMFGRIAKAATYSPKLKNSAQIINQCQLRTDKPIINNSVNISAVNVMATTCRNSDSNSNNEPYIKIPPKTREMSNIIVQ